MKSLFIFIIGSCVGYFFCKKADLFPLPKFLQSSHNIVSEPKRGGNNLKLSEDIKIDGNSFLTSAILTENGKNIEFEQQIYDLGSEINNSVAQSLKLSPEAKNEMNVLLKEHYPEIAAEVRKEYLKNIENLPPKVENNIVSNIYSTRADALSNALNSTICSFSTLIFIPLKLNFSLSTNIAASYFMQNPCESLLVNIVEPVGQKLHNSGTIKDIEATQTQLSLKKESALAELATAEMELKVNSKHSIKRKIGNKKWTLTTWDAASLSIDYNVVLKYGYDLSNNFVIERDDNKRIIKIMIPEPVLLSSALEPLNTIANDGGIADLDNSHFRLLYDQAQSDAIKKAEQNGIKIKAEQEIRTILTYIFSPFTSGAKNPYRLEIQSKMSNNQIM